MATIARIVGRHSRDAVEDRALTAQTVPPSMLTSTPGGATVTPTTALRNADAYACIRALADAAASLPLHAYRRTDTGRVRLEGATADLLRSPAPATTQAGLVGQLVAHLQLHGNAYLGKFRDAAGQVDQLALLSPERVVPELKGGRPIYTVLDGQGGRSVHGTDDVIHVKALTTDGLVGLSPVKQCRVALGLSQTLAEHGASFFANSARPDGILKLGGHNYDRDEMDDLRAGWQTTHGGVRNSHRVAIMTGDVDFTPLSMPLDDAQFLEQRRLSATEVARCFRVPPWIVGADSGGSMTYSNTEQQSLHFVTYSLRPWLVAIEQALSADTDLFPPGAYCEFLLDALLRADSKTRAEVYALALHPEQGWMTRAEVRRLENLEPESEPPKRKLVA